MIIQNKLELTETELKAIEYIKEDKFPWYYQNSSSEKFNTYCHTMMTRVEGEGPFKGTINSFAYELFENLFLRYCLENSVEVETILRAALNIGTYDPRPHCDIHTDHDFPHYNFLFYLNDFDEGYTLVYENGENNIPTKITPEKNLGVVFGGHPHAHTFCKVGQRRLVLVFTFLGKLTERLKVPSC